MLQAIRCESLAQFAWQLNPGAVFRAPAMIQAIAVERSMTRR
jgi:hypothetical protein